MALKTVPLLYRNLNFRQAVSLKLLKIITVCRDAPCQSFLTMADDVVDQCQLDIDLPHHLPCCAGTQPMFQQIADAADANVALFGCNWHVYQVICCKF